MEANEPTSDLLEAEEVVSEERQQFDDSMRELSREVSLDEIEGILSQTIRRDKTTKLITFLSYLLTYTEDNQINLCFKSESARGKSYIAIETAKYFPEEDVMKIGYASPTAFFHQKGLPMFEGNDEDEKRKFSHFLVDLSKKILIFLDQPNNSLLERLRPLLSHDQKQYESFITDRSEKYGLRTKKVVINGYPSVAFCTAKMQTDEQEATRVVILSPEATQEKLDESTKLVGLKEAHRGDFKKELEENPERKWLLERVHAVKTANIDFIDIENINMVWNRFRKLHPFLQPRHQRDYYRLIAFIKAHALLNCWHRTQHNSEQKTIVANETDIEAGFKLYKKIYESNELGLAPEIYEIWKQVIEPLLKYIQGVEEVGIKKEDILRAFYQKYHRTLPDDRLRRIIIPQLESAGLIVLDKDPEDQRRKIIKRNITKEEEKLYGGEGVGSEAKNNISNSHPPPSPHISPIWKCPKCDTFCEKCGFRNVASYG